MSGDQPSYSTGSIIWIKGVRHVVCRSCPKVGRAAEGGRGLFGCGICEDYSWSSPVEGMARLAM